MPIPPSTFRSVLLPLTTYALLQPGCASSDEAYLSLPPSASIAPPTAAVSGRPQLAQPVTDSAGAAGLTAVPEPSDCAVQSVPDAVRSRLQLGEFYQKYSDARGVTVVSSDKPSDKTLNLACQLLNDMLFERPDVRAALIANDAFFAIVASAEKTTDIPEYRDLPDYYNRRARGLGGRVGLCAEESILCDTAKDRWRGESICVHEYSHTIAMYGLYTADATFEQRLTDSFKRATSAGLWKNTYSAQEPQEYWAEGVQDWYSTNLESIPANGVHGEIDTKQELQQYDPALYQLIDELLPDETRWPDCYRKQPGPSSTPLLDDRKAPLAE